MKKLLTITGMITLLCALAACQNEKNASHEEAPHKEQHSDENSAEGQENTARLTSAQIKSIGLELGAIEEKELTAALKANGTLKVPNQNRATVNTLYSGVIRTLHVQPGDNVRKGQVIATIANPEFMRSQEEYVAVNQRIELAELEFNRQKELSAGNAGALKNFQAAATELKTLQTRRNMLHRQISLMDLDPERLGDGKLIATLSVKSPIAGVVSDVDVQIGSYVDLTSPIAEIVDNSQLHLDLFVYEKDLPKLRDEQIIHFTLTNAPGKEYDARIFSLGSSFEGESKAVPVHAKVMGNKTGLIDGMNITAAVSLKKAKVPAVPTEAIVSYQGRDYVFIASDAPQHDDDPHDHAADDPDSAEAGVTFELIPVARGTTDVGYTEITLLKSIPADARVVVKGAFFVLAKMSSPGGEHAH